MSKFLKGLVAAMESETEGEEQAIIEVAPEAADTLETDMLETNEHLDEAEEIQEAIEDAEEGAEQLEAISDVMEEAGEKEGGVSEDAAKIAEIAVESIYARLGVKKRAVMPAMESFATKTTRLNATKVAVEEFREQAKIIWGKIVAAIKMVWDKISDFFAKLFDANVKLKTRAESMRASALKLTGEAKEKEIEVSASVVAVSGSSAVKAPDVMKIANAIQEAMSSFKLEDMVKGDKSISDAFEKAVQSEFTVSTAHGVVAGAKTYVSSAMFPNKAIAITISDDSEQKALASLKRWWKVGVSVVEADAKKEAPKAGKVATLSISDIQSSISATIVNCDILAKNKQNFDKLATAAKQFVAELKKQESKDYTDDQKEIVSAAQKTAPKISATAAKLSSSYSTLVVNGGKVLLDYCEKSMKQYAAK